MNKKTLKNLEYYKIIEKLKNNCITYIGKDLAEGLVPSSDFETVKKLQQETSEACSLSLRRNTPPLSPISNMSNIFNKINIGSILSIEELLKVGTTLKIFREVKEYFREDSDNNAMEHAILRYDILSKHFEMLYSNKNLESEIFRCIKSESDLDDRASSELYKIRKKITDAEIKIKDKLNSIIHSSSTSKYLQDAVVTFRDGRYVIPVKQEYKNEINGLVHDMSSSGSTIFIEPTAVFNINNEIKELHIEEKKEIERILSLLTQMVSPLTNELITASRALGQIDFAFAKAKLALDMEAYEPKLNSNGYIHLNKARHPLLNGNSIQNNNMSSGAQRAPLSKSVVPIDVWLGDKFNTLVITGPNTGGKTVTLKTVGLLTLMMQSGLHVPAAESSEMAVFENIYSDIGDEQSIEQSLSTFSAHMTNIVAITDKITNKDLVLLDELCSGTDPVEGSALARSILKYLHDFNCRTIATTHYSELKTFAMQQEGMENASCEFDFEKLSPTYKLLIGVPGRSNAFLISKKLGLSDHILSNANEYVSEETVKFEDILTNMEQDKKSIQEQKELSDKMLNEARMLKESAEKMSNDINSRKTEILNKAKIEARDLLLDAEEEANRIIKDLIEIKTTSSKEQYKRAEENRQKIKKSISEIQKDLLLPSKSDSINSINLKEIKKGLRVYIPSLDQEATIISLPDRNGNVTIQSGIMKLNMHYSNIEKIKEDKISKKVVATNIVRHKNSQKNMKTMSVATEINLLGMTVDEAISVLEKFLDDAYLSGLHEVRIVHGKGTGLLRKGVQNYLRSNPYIESFRLGMYGEGDSGVTIAEIKK
ncbi:MAG: endonuclease MutS2 [Clostridia bacterium]|nr:endonuclease MutS2 [Clostridia bacterium]